MKMKLTGALLVWLSVWGCGASGKQAGTQEQTDSVSFVQLEFKVPSKLKAVALELHPYENQPALLTKELDNLEGTVHIQDSLVRPHRGPIAVLLQMNDGSIWTARVEEGTGKFEPVRLAEEPEPSEIKYEYIRQHRMPVEPGEYSGICRVKDDVYALVHDKSKGGGIHYFNIPLDQAGVIGPINQKEAPGNASGVSGADNEDIVYVPSSNTLYVCSEADQAIREYTIEGTPTGISMTIPEDLKAIQSNAGFEALAYDPANNYFWAATEKSLKDEGLNKNIIRLQRFSGTNPDARYLYLMTPPMADESQASGAQAYVHGISAMTALEDGRLIVLEREVYVPGGSVIEKALGAFTLSTLYIVDPLHDKGGILEKKLLARILTSAINLANYEGMCLGPKLSGGRQSLLLVADSQNGQGGLTGEYLQILSIKP